MKKIILFLLVLEFPIMQAQTWNTTRNNLPSGNVELGVNNNRSVKFVTNDTVRMIMDSLGVFTIPGLADASLPDGFDQLLYTDANGVVKTGGNAAKGGCGTSPWYINGNKIVGAAGNGVIGTCNNYDFIFETNDTDRVWLKNTGNFGIGTASPEAKFQVLETKPVGPNTGDSRLVTSVGAKPGSGNYLYNNLWLVRRDQGTNDWWNLTLHDGVSLDYLYNQPGVDTKTWWQRSPHYDVQEWGHGPNRYMSLEQGRLFVGQERIQSNHLHANSFVQIDGKLACKELVIIDPSKWADFVFANDYKLKPLSELEKFYTLNKHLPDVPSEKEVKTNGINSADMDAVLLQKIEELTLYIVELNKRINTLEKANTK